MGGDEGRRGSCQRDSGRFQFTAGGAEKEKQKRKEHIRSRSVECFPTITQYSLSLWSLLTHLSLSNISSNTRRAAAPIAASTSTDMFRLLA